MASPTRRCYFLDDFPAEVRLQIYRYHFYDLLTDSTDQLKRTKHFTKPTSPLFLTSKLIRHEVRPFYMPQLRNLKLTILLGTMESMGSRHDAVTKIRPRGRAARKARRAEIENCEEAWQMWDVRDELIREAMAEEKGKEEGEEKEEEGEEKEEKGKKLEKEFKDARALLLLRWAICEAINEKKENEEERDEEEEEEEEEQKRTEGAGEGFEEL